MARQASPRSSPTPKQQTVILLPIVLTPAGITVLLFVMSWTERALDREPRPERTLPAHILPAATVAVPAPVELARLTEPLIAQGQAGRRS